MLKIIGMTKDELLGLHPDSFRRPGSIQLLTEEEVVYMAETLGAFWKYNYEAAKKGKVGMHAILKSEWHSDGFFISRILLEPSNIRRIMAEQQVLRFNQLGIPKPDWVAGIPDGATQLGMDVAEVMGVKNAEMRKEDKHIAMVSTIAPDETLLWDEDFCTKGTGLREAVSDVLSKQPKVKILPLELVIINRGGLTEIVMEGVGNFQVVAVADHRINDWPSPDCPLCKMGSVPIKPKATDENWRLITTSQQ